MDLCLTARGTQLSKKEVKENPKKTDPKKLSPKLVSKNVTKIVPEKPKASPTPPPTTTAKPIDGKISVKIDYSDRYPLERYQIDYSIRYIFKL